MDKLTVCKKIGATYLFVGDDWYGTEKWQKYEEFAKEGIKIVYFPYTKGISSTKITELMAKNMWGRRHYIFDSRNAAIFERLRLLIILHYYFDEWKLLVRTSRKPLFGSLLA